MKYTLTVFCCAIFLCAMFLCGAFLCGTLFAQEGAPPVGQLFNTKLADMQSDDANRMKNGQQDWQRVCFQAGAPGQEELKAEVLQLMAEALEKGGLNSQTTMWLLRQMGRLDDGGHAELIGQFFADEDRLVHDEAVWSLANIPNEKARVVIEDLLSKENDDDRTQALQNALKYRAERKAVDLPKLDEILKSLESGNPNVHQHVLPNLPWLVDVRFSDVPNYKERFEKLNPQSQSLLMDGLVSRRDKTALPLALSMIKSDEAQIRLAGFRALGPLGDEKVLPFLLDNIKEGGDFGNTVRDSLARLNYNGADKMLLEMYEKATDDGIKLGLLNVFNRRKGTIAIPAFEAGLKSANETIRRESIRSLELLGQQASIPALVNRYFVEEKRDILDKIERAIVQIESRYGDEDGRGKMFCGVIAKRNEAEQVQLLPIAGRIGGPDVGTFVLEQYKNGRPAIQEAAFRALCNWTDTSIADELLKVASSQDDPRAPVAARSYIRIVTLHEHGRNDADKLAYVERAMSIAKSDDDKRFLLSRLDPSRCIEVFRFAVQYIDDPNLDQAAFKAVIDMANDTGFHTRYRAEIDPYLDKVIERSTENNYVERAKRFKDRR